MNGHDKAVKGYFPHQEGHLPYQEDAPFCKNGFGGNR